jgi:hypothetical protein
VPRLIPLMILMAPAALAAQGPEWKIHSLERPRPTVVHPGGAAAVPPPADAIVLFDGHSLDAWRSNADSAAPAPWRIVNGAMEVVPGRGGIHTATGFGSVQLHVEWMTPVPPRESGQNRGNSGVFLMGQYEVQVLDSWENDTYADGQAGAIYGQFPPMVNAALPPGTWQSYDILFHRPHFDAAGKVTQPARLTVIHNGVVVQWNAALLGPTSHMVRDPYEAHPDRLPISLQDHGHPVRFRNIWVRPLPDHP